MPTTITSGRWALDYTNRILYRDTSVTATVVDSVLDLHKDLLDLFDVSTQMDDPTPMSAQTPSEFTVGDPEGNDPETPWFVSPESCKYLYGGAIQTNSWTRTATSENGIVVVPYDGTIDPVAADIGKTITHDPDGDVGVLLGFDTVRGELYIRPSTDAAINSFDSVSGNLDVTAGTANVGNQTAAATTGEFTFANPFSLAPSLQTGTRIYVAQDGTKRTDFPAGVGLNVDGQIDVLLAVKVADVLVDDGYITMFARRGGTVYAHFTVDLSAGGRVPVPLAPQNNALNDGVGHYNATWTGGSGTALVAGDIVAMDTPSTGETAAIVAAVTDSGATGDFDYFLIRSLNVLAAGAASAESPSTKVMTIAVVSNLAPADDAATISPLVFAATDIDIANGAGPQPYSINVDPNSIPFARVYRALEFMLRRGSTEQLDGMDGEQYTGSTVQIEYNTQTGAFVEGEVVWDTTTGAFGTVVADHDDGATGDLILRNVRGTFTAANIVGDAAAGPTDFATIASVRSIPTLPSAPLGNIAGGVYFGAPGMYFTLVNIFAGEEQSYQLVDDDGVTQSPPNTVPVEVTALGTNDWVSVFRLDAALASGGKIVKTDYTGHATNNNLGGTTYEVTGTIGQEVPPTGVVAVVDSVDVEEHYWYDSFATTIFTLTTIADQLVDGSSADGLTVTDVTNGNFIVDGVLPGMIIRNITDGSWGIVKSVDSATQLTLETQNNGQGLVGGSENDWDSGLDTYSINKLRIDLDSKPTYVPFLHAKNTAGTDESTTVIQSTTIFVMVRVRQGRVILPFVTGQTIGANGMSQAAIRTLDTIAT